MSKLRVPSFFFEINMSREEGHSSKECDKPLTPEFLATITCRRCEKTGHLGADCPEKPKLFCSNCDGEGHRARDCTVYILVMADSGLLQEPQNLAKVQCKECNKIGHFAKECPNKKCRNCEKAGHHFRDCPVNT